MAKPLAFIGIGSMGGPMALQLLRHGHRVTVYDTDQARMQVLATAGARLAASPLDASSSAEAAFLCLPSVAALHDVALGENGIANTRDLELCVNFSTAGPSAVREIAEVFRERGMTFMDCPITGGAAAARDGKLSITVSGERAGYERLKPLLDCVAAHIFYVGALPGQAQLMKLLNNMLSFAAFVSTCEAFAVGVKAGLDADAMVAVINTGTGRNSATTDKFPRNILTRTFDYGARLAISYKDISLFLEEADRLGVPTWLAPMVRQVIGYVVSQDGDCNDVTTIAKHYEKWCGVEFIGAGVSGPPETP